MSNLVSALVLILVARGTLDMDKLCFAWLVVVFTLLGVNQAASQTGPALLSEGTHPDCQAAHEMAHAAFESTSPSLIWPVINPDSTGNLIALARGSMDISGGDGVLEDTTIFERVGVPSRMFRVLFWARQPQDNQRIVVFDQSFSWRGDHYYLISLPSSVTQEEFIDQLGTEELQRDMANVSSWHPPVVLNSQHSGDLWVIDQGLPNVALPT